MPIVSVPAEFAAVATTQVAAANTAATTTRCFIMIPIICGSLGRDADARQILEPTLRLYETLHLGRHRPRIEVMHDENHHRLLALELVQLGQQRQPFLAVEFVEDLVDQRLGFRALEMAPIRALWRP